jgi:hypothetical protein
MDWDQAVAYTLTQTTQALNELKSGTQPSTVDSSLDPSSMDASQA